MAHKLDIFKVLSDISSHNDVYSKLTPEERKGFSPLVIMRWLSGTQDQEQILRLNHQVNPYVYTLAKHPHLLSKLLGNAATGKSRRYQWLGIKAGKKNAETIKVLSQYFDMSAREARQLLVPPTAELLSFAEQLGWSNEDIKKLSTELK